MRQRRDRGSGLHAEAESRQRQAKNCFEARCSCLEDYITTDCYCLHTLDVAVEWSLKAFSASLPHTVTSMHLVVLYTLETLLRLRRNAFVAVAGQRQCNFGGIKEQLEGIRKRVPFIGQRWRYRERRESLRSLCKTSGTVVLNENSCENGDSCG